MKDNFTSLLQREMGGVYDENIKSYGPMELRCTRIEIGKENKLVRKFDARLNDDVVLRLRPRVAHRLRKAVIRETSNLHFLTL